MYLRAPSTSWSMQTVHRDEPGSLSIASTPVRHLIGISHSSSSSICHLSYILNTPVPLYNKYRVASLCLPPCLPPPTHLPLTFFDATDDLRETFWCAAIRSSRKHPLLTMRWRAVPSLHCSSCEDHLKSVLSSVPRFRDVSTNVPQHTVTFTIDPGDTDDNNTSSLSRNSLVRNVQRVLNASGYASYRDHQRAGGLFRRLTNAVLGHERRLHERHLTHCAACQEAPSQHEEKDDGASLTTVQVDSRAPPKVVETRIAIEGMTCRCAICIAHLLITAGLIKFHLCYAPVVARSFSTHIVVSHPDFSLICTKVHALLRSHDMSNNFPGFPK